MKPNDSKRSLLFAAMMMAGCAEQSPASQPTPVPEPTDGAVAVQEQVVRPAPRRVSLPPLSTSLTERERAVLERAQEGLSAPLPVEEPAAPKSPKEDDVATADLGDVAGLSLSERAAIADDPAARALATPTRATPALDKTPKKAPPQVLPTQGVTVHRVVGALNLARLTIAEDVVGRSPVNAATHFATAPAKLHCYCVFENRGEPTMVTHVWRRNGKLVSRVELEVGRSPKWRTWSRQRLSSGGAGMWSCEVVARDSNTQLGIVSVTVGTGR